jgi:hypothetical protein
MDEDLPGKLRQLVREAMTQVRRPPGPPSHAALPYLRGLEDVHTFTRLGSGRT